MLRKILFGLLAVAALLSYAELKKAPDANTLWEIRQCADKDWDGGGRIYIKDKQDKGFAIGDDNPSNKVAHSKFWKVPVSAEYPWMCFQVTAATPFKGYRSWGIGLHEVRTLFGSSTNAETGIVAFNVFEGLPPIKAGNMKLWAYFYDFELDFSYIKMVKTPENYVFASSPAFAAKKSYGPGDRIKFTVVLKDPAEEVQLRLVNREYFWAVKLNGSDVVDLKPEDEAGRVWSAEKEVKTMTTSKTAYLNRNCVLMRVSVMGGELDVPLWGTIAYPFR